MQDYDSDFDDGLVRRSPGLQAIKVRPTPSPSPPPLLPDNTITVNVSKLSCRTGSKSDLAKIQPSQGERVLILSLDPNRPDIASAAGAEPLVREDESVVDPASPRGRDSEDEEDDLLMDMETVDEQSPAQVDAMANLVAQAAAAIAVTQQVDGDGMTAPAQPEPNGERRKQKDSPMTDAQPARESEWPKSITTEGKETEVAGNATPNALAINGLQPPHDRTSSVTDSLERTSAAQKYSQPSESIMSSPPLRDNVLNLGSMASPEQVLPAMSESPNRDRSLPSIKEVLPSQGDASVHSRPYHQHRQSFSSATGLSPTLQTRLPPNGHPMSPQETFFSPGQQTSPMSSRHGMSPPSGIGSAQFQSFVHQRRPSQLSENGLAYSPLPSATTMDSTSTESWSPHSQLTPSDNRMNIDAAFLSGPAHRQLPPPVPQTTGSYKCSHPGCTAAPFQTQYLLNSHANVHSQSRPHYCPVKGCPRGEGGKGFKRKNEMIRHGLVHDSPGYVCPFCPDREHKYPRPDNLQRHVRVHHVDKDKDDPLLRDVLLARPDGSQRGRRRQRGN